jgi:hypothetical protein
MAARRPSDVNLSTNSSGEHRQSSQGKRSGCMYRVEKGLEALDFNRQMSEIERLLGGNLFAAGKEQTHTNTPANFEKFAFVT